MSRARLIKQGDNLVATTEYAKGLLAEFGDGENVVAVIKGDERSVAQNNLSHAWYSEIAKKKGDESPLEIKCFCKLNFGVPILRAEEEDYRETYDVAIKHSLNYEQKLIAMRHWPVTSEMNTKQLSNYLDCVQNYYLQQHGICVRFPDELRHAA